MREYLQETARLSKTGDDGGIGREGRFLGRALEGAFTDGQELCLR